ncbi:hypothetical protein V6N12_024037 [Hibiscus sabdariffa]|uniref:Uncharacterized protein n=1 Tax=Hibiscus sabdariffa TaxID=183260 RepID=A0ABR2FZF2_9ROSI
MDDLSFQETLKPLSRFLPVALPFTRVSPRTPSLSNVEPLISCPTIIKAELVSVAITRSSKAMPNSI